MSAVVSCPSCQGKLRVPEDLLGTRVRCPTCSDTFYAPGDEEPPPPPRRPREREPYPDDGEEEDYPRPRGSQLPGKVQAIAIMTLVGGIVAVLYGIGWIGIGLGTCICLAWPGTYYSFVVGILAIVKGSQLLSAEGKQGPPQAVAIMQIINVVNGDLFNCVMGILTLVFLNEPEVKRYFARPRRRPRYEEDY